MAKSLKFTCTKINTDTGQGKLIPDADGYFKLVVGAFDAFNGQGDFYPMEPAKKVFTAGSSLMRRLTSGSLKGEMGHPKRLPGMSAAAHGVRLASVHEENVSHHFKSLELKEAKDDKGRDCVLVVAELKPCGPQGANLKESLENPHENIAFSIRAPVNDTYKGIVKHRAVTSVVTWDAVIEPGIKTANKFDSIGLESLDETVIPEVLLFNGNRVNDIGHALESAGIDIRSLIQEDVSINTHASSKW